MHRHPDTEDLVVLSGTIECLKITENGHEWVSGKAGDFFHVPSMYFMPGAMLPPNPQPCSSQPPKRWDAS
jgi:hypothetical protein